MSLRFFDCNCSLGRFALPQPGVPFSAGELLAEMNYVGIDQALVYHAWAREYSPTHGNEQLLNEIADYDRFTACWVVMPHHTGELPPPAEMVAQIVDRKVRAVRIFPASSFHNWSLSEWSAKPLIGALESRRIPLFVGFDQVTWDEVYALCKSYPALPVVVTEVRYEEWRHLYPLLETLPNLHIDLCWMIVHFGLEAAVEHFGARRFLFGSRMPIFSAAPAVNHLQYASIADADKALIAGGNLRRLISW